MLDSATLKNKAVQDDPPLRKRVKTAHHWDHAYDKDVCSSCGQPVTPPAIQGVHWREDGTASVYNARSEEDSSFAGTHAETLQKLKDAGIEWGRLPFHQGVPKIEETSS